MCDAESLQYERGCIVTAAKSFVAQLNSLVEVVVQQILLSLWHSFSADKQQELQCRR